MSPSLRRICLLLLAATGLHAQYASNRVTEQSFEPSDRYFTSHFLNTFALRGFEDLAVGLVENPFLTLQLNPALMPDLEKRPLLLYMDFRGDRGEADLYDDIRVYEPLALYDAPAYSYWWDPRWYQQPRTEPLPLVSGGIIHRPGGDGPFYWALTYQLVRENQPYFQPYGGFWYGSPYVDAFGNDIAVREQGMVIDRSGGVDEFAFRGHLGAFHSGLRVSDRISLGAAVNLVDYDQEGRYQRFDRKPFGNLDPWSYENDQDQKRENGYRHWDVSGGIVVDLRDDLRAGAKAGWLDGLAEQDYTYRYLYVSQNNTPFEGTDWAYNWNRNHTDQSWERDGGTRYGRLFVQKDFDEGVRMTAQYRFSRTDLDLSTASAISDSGYYNSRWTGYETSFYRNFHTYSLTDSRSGTGNRLEDDHITQFAVRWPLSERTTISAGIQHRYVSIDSDVREPVTSRRYSGYFSYYPPESTDSTLIQQSDREVKTLDWSSRSRRWTVNLPVIADIRFNEHWEMRVGVTRRVTDWNIDEEVIAEYDFRERTEDGTTVRETDFAERYSEPGRSYTESETDLIAGFTASLTPQFQIQLLLDPDFDETFRVRQWWLTFQARL